ncbi:FBL4 [Symbiodinium pilosum]|uniref:FBL4 protein n=1 Tax=Symbiodinium pilosum TaxID=2952 RepID=A0A812TSZ7_SYMPI|nr:FBL4 [Symbiodinium pilosum]
MTKEQFQEHMQQLQRKFKRKLDIAQTEHRGLSLGQLHEIQSFAQEHCGLWRDLAPAEYSKTSGQTLQMDFLNLYHLCTWCILPATHVENCSFVELLADGDQIPNWFCSHWWGEPIQDFICCVEAHQTLRQSDLYWICAYANRQHSLHEELVTDPSETSFYKAMRLSKGVLIILDELGPATPFTRIWCAFEAYVALVDRPQEEVMLLDISCYHDKTTYILTDGLAANEAKIQERGNELSALALAQSLKSLREMCFPVAVFERGLSLELHHAQASRDLDRRRILNSFVGRTGEGLDEEPYMSHPKYDEVNIRLRSVLALAAWNQMATSQSKQLFLDVAACLAADRWRDTLTFDLSRLPTAGDVALQGVGQSLPPQLQQLKLDCSSCSKLTSSGFEAFAENLPQGLTSLMLNLSRCEGLSDKDVAVLVAHMPRTLQKLDLWLAQCSITDISLAALADGIQMALLELKELKVNLCNCSKIGDPGLAALGSRLPSSLRYLKVVLAGRQRLTDAGLAALLRQLPPDVEEVEVALVQSDWLTDAGFAAAIAALPPSLQQATLRADICSGLSLAARRVSGQPLVSLRAWMEASGEVPASPANCAAALFDEARGLLEAKGKGRIATPELEDGWSLSLPIPQDQLDLVLPSLIFGLRHASHLQHLALDFQDCPDFGDEELESLVSALPSGLLTLNLCLWGLGKISSAGTRALSAALPSALSDFTLMLGGRYCDVASALATLALSRTQLTKLTVYVSSLNDESLATFVFNLPSCLQHLSLTLMEGYWLSDAGLAALAAYLPDAVVLKLELNTGTDLSQSALEVARSATRESLQAWLKSSGAQPAKASGV